MKLFISGSVARDLIMDFPGRFADFIQPDKIHVLNLSFAVENMRENLGGTAANIVYNLGLLGEPAAIIGAIGSDRPELKTSLRKSHASLGYLQVSRSLPTAAAYIITDRDDNQIAGFYAGAMNEPTLLPKAARAGDWAVIAAENPRNMAALAAFYRRRGVNYIFDPGQQITALSRAQLAQGLTGAAMLIGNDYEIAHTRKRISRLPGIVVRTLGPRGSEISIGRTKPLRVAAVKARHVVDPTGAGDAYRAGLLKGLKLGYNLKIAAQLGATVAVYAVENYGTQNHRFTWKELRRRHNRNFKEKI